MAKLFGIIFSVVTISSAHLSMVHAENWDMGYAKPSPEVEEIPDSINGDTKADIVEAGDVHQAADQDQEKPPVSSFSNITKISTAQNTFGVETVEKTGLKLYISPVAGLTSVMGNGTVDVIPQYAFGGRAGLLVSDNVMVEGGFTYSVMNTSTPINLYMGGQPSDVFALKQSVIDGGAKIFFLGREHRFRPFIGGGIAYANSSLNYTPAYSSFFPSLTDDYKIKQLQGLGQVGAEIAITRGIVATAAFKLNGVLSTSTQSISNASTATGLEAGKVQAGDSLSHSATYTGTVGMGVYF